MLEACFLMIELKKVTKIFPNGVRALNDISLTINKGDFVFLVGPSGAGKTTLLRMLVGVMEQTSGNVEIDGQNYNEVGLFNILQREVF